MGPRMPTVRGVLPWVWCRGLRCQGWARACWMKKLQLLQRLLIYQQYRSQQCHPSPPPASHSSAQEKSHCHTERWYLTKGIWNKKTNNLFIINQLECKVEPQKLWELSSQVNCKSLEASISWEFLMRFHQHCVGRVLNTTVRIGKHIGKVITPP